MKCSLCSVVTMVVVVAINCQHGLGNPSNLKPLQPGPLPAERQTQDTGASAKNSEANEFGPFASGEEISGKMANSSLIAELRYDCPSPWFRLDNKCFRWVKEQRNWFSARAYCQNSAPNANLAQPSDLYWVKALAQCLLDIGYVAGTGGLYLGGSDLSVEGQWRWISGSAISSGWEPGQPDAYAPDWNCLFINPGRNDGVHILGDGPCGIYTAFKTGFICERH